MGLLMLTSDAYCCSEAEERQFCVGDCKNTHKLLEEIRRQRKLGTTESIEQCQCQYCFLAIFPKMTGFL